MTTFQLIILTAEICMFVLEIFIVIRIAILDKQPSSDDKRGIFFEKIK